MLVHVQPVVRRRGVAARGAFGTLVTILAPCPLDAFDAPVRFDFCVAEGAAASGRCARLQRTEQCRRVRVHVAGRVSERARPREEPQHARRGCSCGWPAALLARRDRNSSPVRPARTAASPSTCSGAYGPSGASCGRAGPLAPLPTFEPERRWSVRAVR